ncbi:MAG: hypothetical protein U5O16_37380 [Rhodococcus sp. (in: high G+C Gram-positive bacteria)]|uniref:hypothetical protein n=1 Tax=Rhodococcus sp. TaxID=1831 RepID=UPI002AD773A3|nr:hypothetical protein [Rhodococcus sp. (in: high G+C Gram-positive bacteria)]
MTSAALLPILLLVISVPAALIEDTRGTLIGDVLNSWNLVGVFGLVVVVPVMTVSLFGAGALAEQFRFGRWLASIGSVGMVLVAAAAVYGAVAEVITPAAWRDPYSWSVPLSPFATALFIIPYLVIAAINIYVIARLWKGTVRV